MDPTTTPFFKIRLALRGTPLFINSVLAESQKINYLELASHNEEEGTTDSSHNHLSILGLYTSKDFYNSNGLACLNDTSSDTTCSTWLTGRAHQMVGIITTFVISKYQF
jgi:hypothetical protein